MDERMKAADQLIKVKVIELKNGIFKLSKETLKITI